jgi:hypothetical protein
MMLESIPGDLADPNEHIPADSAGRAARAARSAYGSCIAAASCMNNCMLRLVLSVALATVVGCATEVASETQVNALEPAPQDDNDNLISKRKVGRSSTYGELETTPNDLVETPLELAEDMNPYAERER